MFSRPKILFLVSLLFVALLNSIPTYLLNFQFFYQSSHTILLDHLNLVTTSVWSSTLRVGHHSIGLWPLLLHVNWKSNYLLYRSLVQLIIVCGNKQCLANLELNGQHYIMERSI